jgi:ATP phosphoribosyltransferase
MLALTKGRLEKRSIELFERSGFNVSELKDAGRKLTLPMTGYPMDVVLAKAPDVITYVEHGVCDLGIVGKDTIMERGRNVYELLDLGFGRCRFALAAQKGSDFYGTYRSRRIATKYPEVARAFFLKKGMDVQIIQIEGSVELAPILGLSDAIFDIVETGTTLKENGLEPIEFVHDISARLIVNVASMKMRKAEVYDFVEKLRGRLEGNV